MQKSLQQRVRSYVRKHVHQKWWRRVIMAMACIVVFATTYALILPAITMTVDTYCGKEEHVHTKEECYERVLVCGLDDTGANNGAEAVNAETQHQHGENCYETRRILVCGLEESAGHTHTES